MKRGRNPAVGLVAGTAVLLVVGYNFWSYCCGRCSAATFLRLGPFGYTLIGINLLAAALLVFLKARRRRCDEKRTCSCGTVTAHDWRFCPRCGVERRAAELEVP